MNDNIKKLIIKYEKRLFILEYGWTTCDVNIKRDYQLEQELKDVRTFLSDLRNLE